VIELGAGTGVFTRAIIARGIPEEQLALVEMGSDFVRLLQARFPVAKIVRIDATRLKEIEPFGGIRAGAVVSGLPLLSMKPRKVMAILDGAFRHLRSDGSLYQFTYGPRCPIPRVLLDRLGLKAIRIGGVFANFPPAAVYRIRRRPGRSARSAHSSRSGDGDWFAPA
jgi:phospholipid N-methyltransferase